MNAKLLLATVSLLAVGLAGCADTDFEGDAFFTPGQAKETGNTVHLRMYVADLVKADIYPGLVANMWAFCAEPADPEDTYSANAIEYQNPTGVIEKVDSATNEFVLDTEKDGKCSVPGPTIRVQQGDKVIVDFQNNHFHPHTIHWHGQYVPWESDGVPGATQDTVVPTTSFRYEFVALREGTLWYHCHVDTQFHVMMGLYGAFIVEPQDKTYEPKDIDKDYTWVLGTATRQHIQRDPDVTDPHAKHKHGSGCGTSGFPNCVNPRVDVDPDVFMINGRSFPNTEKDNNTLIQVSEGDRVRLRLINAGGLVETIHTHGHDFLVTHKDGLPLHPLARFWADTISIGPAERWDVLLIMDNPGVWVAHTHIESHNTNDGIYLGGMHSAIVYDGFEGGHHDGGFLTELPGGLDYAPPVFIPDDVILNEVHELEDTLLEDGVLAEMQFPVELPCAVERIRVSGQHFGTADTLTGALGVNSFTVRILDPEGNEVMTGEPGEDGSWSMLIQDTIEQQPPKYRVADLQQGNYTMQLVGQSLDSEALLGVHVDYYRSLEAAFQGAFDVQREKCPNSPLTPYNEVFYTA